MKVYNESDRQCGSNGRLGATVDVLEILRASVDQKGIVVATDDDVMRRIAVDIDLLRERIGYRKEAAHELRQQALDEELAAERLKAVLRAVGRRSELAEED